MIPTTKIRLREQMIFFLFLFGIVDHGVFIVLEPVDFLVVLTTFIVFVSEGKLLFFVLIFFILVARGRFEGLSNLYRDGFLALLVALQISIILLFFFPACNALAVGL